jgi:hypothetical protein
LLLVPGWHVPFSSQQPAAQVSALQTGGAMQLRLAVSHVPPFVATQFSHVPPAGPHAVLDVPDWHIPVESQQPPGHVAALHPRETVSHVWTVELHASPGGQVAHATPPVPQVADASPVVQWSVPSQQPWGHVAGLHAM